MTTREYFRHLRRQQWETDPEFFAAMDRIFPAPCNQGPVSITIHTEDDRPVGLAPSDHLILTVIANRVREALLWQPVLSAYQRFFYQVCPEAWPRRSTIDLRLEECWGTEPVPPPQPQLRLAPIEVPDDEP